MDNSAWFVTILKIAVAFGIMAFCIALGMALVSGVDFLLATQRALIAAGVFVVFGGVCSALLAMFLSDG